MGCFYSLFVLFFFYKYSVEKLKQCTYWIIYQQDLDGVL